FIHNMMPETCPMIRATLQQDIASMHFRLNALGDAYLAWTNGNAAPLEDLAKRAFAVAAADNHLRVYERHRERLNALRYSRAIAHLDVADASLRLARNYTCPDTKDEARSAYFVKITKLHEKQAMDLRTRMVIPHVIDQNHLDNRISSIESGLQKLEAGTGISKKPGDLAGDYRLIARTLVNLATTMHDELRQNLAYVGISRMRASTGDKDAGWALQPPITNAFSRDFVSMRLIQGSISSAMMEVQKHTPPTP
ncbi:MAG: hypothetical protein KGQ41_09885, partial [Alphaproteobacteria bacterium]|nr:hypothetical protein [Alphaproteobacteria bacterium]